MSKLNSNSLNVGDHQSGALRQHIEQLMELSKEIINDKLQRQQQRERRIDAVQQRFVSWADRKQSQIKQKMEKSSKIKEEHINKIVKKCKDNDKYLGEKLKTFQNKKKQSLRAAWKLTEKYKIAQQEQERHHLKSKSLGMNKSMAESQLLYKKKISLEKPKQFQISSYGPQNFGNEDRRGKNNPVQLIKNRQRKTSEPIHFMTEADEQQQEREVKNFQEKLQQAFSRFKHNLAEEEFSKIQKLGERLEKIEKSRNRKIQMAKKKKQKFNHFNEDAHQQRREKKVNKSERAHSQSMMKQKRVHDWSEVNKGKRDEFFQSQLEHGNNYLENSKLKFLKTAIAKKIALSTIQKKLYLQRLKH